MTRVTLLMCLTILALTHAAPNPSKRGPEQQDQQETEPEQPEQPVANFVGGPEGPPMEQQFAPQGLEGPQMDQQFAPQGDQQPFAAPMDQQMAPPMDQQQMDCCQPAPTCFNPCPPAAAPISFSAPPPPPPPPPPPLPAAPCCPPGPACANPCAMPPPMPDMGMGMAGCCDPSVMPTCQNPCQPQPPHPPRAAYAPYPGEITMKLKQSWKSELADHASPAYQILAGNLATAVKTALRRDAYISNIYFREGYVPGNPSTQPITVAHFMVDGGSDDASLLQQQVTPDESLGDGLKVYRDSFNAY
ncbi:uncharacterized protein [Porites lutea]|uniref:uncharacterized protein n=1 Tax=Porites lutea TaxID=51062 RepID=UPI003CC51458